MTKGLDTGQHLEDRWVPNSEVEVRAAKLHAPSSEAVSWRQRQNMSSFRVSKSGAAVHLHQGHLAIQVQLLVVVPVPALTDNYGG